MIDMNELQILKWHLKEMQRIIHKLEKDVTPHDEND